jgi:hypothetical protein
MSDTTRPLTAYDYIVAFGMPTAGGVNASADRATILEASHNASDQRTAQGLRQEAKNVWSFLPTIGFSNPFSSPQEKKTPKQDSPTGTFNGPVDIFNLPGEQERRQAMTKAMAPQIGDFNLYASDMMASAVESQFGPLVWNRVDAERLKALDQDFYTYTGSDLRVVVEVAGGRGSYKQLVELSTITTSIHREKSPVRSCGYVNPRAFAYGRRTIAGTIILTQFWMDSMLRFLAENPIPSANGDFEFSEFYRSLPRSSRDTTYHKVDQLPPLNFTLYFADEYGHASVRQLLGVTLVTDGTVYSINDQLTEQTISYMAMDFTPLQPIEIVGKLREFVPAGKTPRDLAAQTLLNPDPMTPKSRNIPLDIPQPDFLVDTKKFTPSAKRLLPPFFGGLF